MQDVEFHIPEHADELAKSAWVPAYDPSRKTLVHVTQKDAERLQNAGYGVGSDAHMMADNDNFYGAAKSFIKGAAAGGSLGLSELAMPADMQHVGEALQKLHPIANMAGNMLGMGAVDAASGGLALIPQLATRVLTSGVRGAAEEIKRTQINNEPIQAERVLQSMGLGALLGAAAEGLGAVVKTVPKLAKGALKKADEVYRPGAWEVAENGAWTRAHRRALADDVSVKSLLGAEMLGHVIPGYGHAVGAASAVLGADKVVTGTLNNLNRVNTLIDATVAPVAKSLSAVVPALTKASVSPQLPYYIKDPDKHYKEASSGVLAVANDPFNFTDAVNAGFGGALQNHLGLQNGIVNNLIQHTAYLHDNLPKDPNQATLAGKFEPTREQKLKFLELYHTLTAFPEAMQTPTPEKIAVAKQLMPGQFALLQDMLRGHITAAGVNGMSQRQKRAVSLILGAPVSPDMQQRYLQGLQATAPAPAAGKPPAAGQGLGVHGAQAVTLRDAPESQKMTLGASF